MSEDIFDEIREMNRRSWLYETKRAALHDTALLRWTFENNDGRNPVMAKARQYVEHWPEAREKALGLLLWGDVGTGKSYFAACIANALLEKGASVIMTNFSRVLGTLGAFYSADRNKYLDELAACDLLIIDDFGMERGTEYSLEQIFSVVDARVRSARPLIVTTNLALRDLKAPKDLTHQRIYDRILGACAPICFSGESRRKDEGAANLELAKKLLA